MRACVHACLRSCMHAVCETHAFPYQVCQAGSFSNSVSTTLQVLLVCFICRKREPWLPPWQVGAQCQYFRRYWPALGKCSMPKRASGSSMRECAHARMLMLASLQSCILACVNACNRPCVHKMLYLPLLLQICQLASFQDESIEVLDIGLPVFLQEQLHQVRLPQGVICNMCQFHSVGDDNLYTFFCTSTRTSRLSSK